MLLEVKGLDVRYGGIRAVKGIDLAVGEGELVCLIGANGAGKSSTLKAICGLHARGGKVTYAGHALEGLPVFELPRRGLVMVPEGRGVFAQLTVEENLAMGAFARDDADVREDLARQYESFPRLRERSNQTAGTLSGGEQQMLAIGRALMSRPKLLLLDEPSMGLAPLMVAKIFDIVREVAARGVTILLVEQNARLALELAHRGYVMESGVDHARRRGGQAARRPEGARSLPGRRRRLSDIGLRGEAVGVELVFRQLARGDEVLARRVDHDRHAAGIDLVLRQVREVLHHRAVHETRAARPVVLRQCLRNHRHVGNAALRGPPLGQRVHVEVLRPTPAPVKRHRPPRCPCAARAR